MKHKLFFPFRTKLKAYFITGLLTIIPVIVIVYITIFIIKILKKFITIPFAPLLTKNIPGIELIVTVGGIIFSVILIILVGLFTASILGKKIFGWFEDVLFSKIPLMNRIYYGAKQLMELLFIKRKKIFSGVVLVEYPRKGVYSVGFITSTNNTQLQAVTGKKVVNLYIPTALNIASGFLLIVPQEEIIPLNLNVEEGLKLVISGGIITPT
jgi:uncharacterized membrane protein